VNETSRGSGTTRLNEVYREPDFHRRPEPKLRKETAIVRADQTAEACAEMRMARAEGVGRIPTEYAGVRRTDHG